MSLSAAARELLGTDRVAHLVTVNADGSPQVTCVWVGLDGDEVVFASMGPWQKIRNIQRNPHVVLSIETAEINATGLLEYIVITGEARVVEGGAADLLQHLARTYLGPDVKFPPMADPPPGYVVRVEVTGVGGVGAWSAEV
jgi:PPOX class probable F420-dependent enzyme